MKALILAISLISMFSFNTAAACEVEVERKFAETVVATRTGKPTAGMVIISFRNPVFTGAVDDQNKYIGDLDIEWPGAQSTQTIEQIELVGRCRL